MKGVLGLPMILLVVELDLLSFFLVLFLGSNVFAEHRFIHPHEITLATLLLENHDRCVAFQLPHRVRHAVLRWYGQVHVDVIRHHVPLHQF
jgi:hypothetical protein